MRELRFHGESYGWEAQFLYDGVLVYGQRFVMHEGALREAEAQRVRWRKADWSPATARPTLRHAGE